MIAILGLSGEDDLTTLPGLSRDICQIRQMRERHVDVACSMVVTGHPPLLLEDLKRSKQNC